MRVMRKNHGAKAFQELPDGRNFNDRRIGGAAIDASGMPAARCEAAIVVKPQRCCVTQDMVREKTSPPEARSYFAGIGRQPRNQAVVWIGKLGRAGMSETRGESERRNTPAKHARTSACTRAFPTSLNDGATKWRATCLAA